MNERVRKQWNIGQPILVANSRITYPVGDRRRSISPNSQTLNHQIIKKNVEFDSPQNPQYENNIQRIEPPHEIYQVNLISTLQDQRLSHDVWIRCWYSVKHNSLFWMDDPKNTSLQPSFYNPTTFQTILLTTIHKLGLEWNSHSRSTRRQSWSGGGSGGGSIICDENQNKSDQEKWIIGYISGLFDKRSPTQKIFLLLEEARKVGVRSLIPVFIREMNRNEDFSQPFIVLSMSRFDFSLPRSPSPPLSSSSSSQQPRRRIIVDCTGRILSFSFKKSMKTLEDQTNNQTLNLLQEFTPLPSPFFIGCRHFHCLNDIQTLQTILSNLNLMDLSSNSDWIPIISKDSYQLLREGSQILRSCLLYEPKTDHEFQIINSSSSLILLCLKIDQNAILNSSDSKLFVNIFQEIMTLLSISSENLDRMSVLVPTILLAAHLAREIPLVLEPETTTSTKTSVRTRISISRQSYSSMPGTLIGCLMSTEISSSLGYASLILLSSLWFRNIFSSLSNKSPFSSTPGSSPWCSLSQLQAILDPQENGQLDDLEETVVTEIFGSFSNSLQFETLIPLIPPVCSWLVYLFQSTSTHQLVLSTDHYHTIQSLTTSITLLFLIQLSLPSSPLSFSPSWDLIQQSLLFLSSSPSPPLSNVQCLIQVLDLLHLIFINLEWLQNKENCQQYHENILQILEECVESLDSSNEIMEPSVLESSTDDQSVQIHSTKLISLLSRCYDFDNFRIDPKTQQLQQRQKRKKHRKKGN